MKTFGIVLILAILIGGGVWGYLQMKAAPILVTSFAECVAAGNPVMESYPRQCNTKDGKHFVEDVGNAIEKMEMIQLLSPHPGTEISSPVTLTGRARGNWYFEASFPIMVVDWNGQIIGEGFATAEGDPATGEVNWMTTEFVPFTAMVYFDTTKIQGNYSNRGALILQKDNPSGLPEHDDALEIPVILK